MNTLYILFLIVFLLVGSWSLKLASTRNKYIQRYMPLFKSIELVLWITVVFWTVHIFFSQKPYYTTLLILLIAILVVMLVWFYIKDIIAGFLFKIRHNPVKGQILRQGEIYGTIREIGSSHLMVESSDGHYRIPYSTIITKTISVQERDIVAVGEAVMKINVPVISNPDYFENAIKQKLAMSSWCIASKPIRVITDTKEPNTLLITFSMIDSAYYQVAKEQLQQVIDTLSAKAKQV